MTSAVSGLPPVVYVPTVGDGPAELRRLELGTGPRGEHELFCYASPDRLRRFYGEVPWMMLRLDQLSRLVETDRVERIHLDALADRGTGPRPDPGYRRPTRREDFPPAYYLPTTDAGPAEDRRVELRRREDGRTVLLAYSTVDRLQGCLGEDTPWLVSDVAGLQRLHDYTPYDMLLLDVAVEGGADA